MSQIYNAHRALARKKGGAATGWVPTVLSFNPVNFWSFNESDPADPAVDRTGNDTGTYQDSPTLGTTATQGTAMSIPDFTGEGRRMEVSSKEDRSFTIIIFLRLDDNTPQLQFVFSATSDDGFEGWSVIIDDGEARGYVADGNVVHTGVMAEDVWTMVAFRWADSTGDRIINLNLASTTNNTSNILDIDGIKSQFGSQVKEAERNNRWLRGSIDEAIYWDSVLSDTDIETIYNAYFA